MARRSEVIQEFWLKSSEIRRRLGAVPRAHTHAAHTHRHTHLHAHTPSSASSTPASAELVCDGRYVCEECVCAEVARRLSIIEQNLLTPPCSPAVHANSNANSNSNSNSNANSNPNLFDGSDPKLDTDYDPSLIPDLSADPKVDLNLDPETDSMPCCKVDFDPSSRSVPLVCEVLLSSSAPNQSVDAQVRTSAHGDPDVHARVASDAQVDSAKHAQQVTHTNSDTDTDKHSHFVYPDVVKIEEKYAQTSPTRSKVTENGTGGHSQPDARETVMHAGRTGEQRAAVEAAEQRRRLGLFSPRKTLTPAHTLPSLEKPKQKSLWKSVFSGYRKKKKEVETPGAVGGVANQEANKKRPQVFSRNTGEEERSLGVRRKKENREKSPGGKKKSAPFKSMLRVQKCAELIVCFKYTQNIFPILFLMPSQVLFWDTLVTLRQS